MVANLKILKYLTQLQFDLRYEKIVPNYAKKSIFMMMTSSMTSQGGFKVGPLYSFINEIITFFMITKQRAKISSLNFLCLCIIRLWQQLYEYIFMTSLMTSPGHKIGQKSLSRAQNGGHFENFEILNTASIWPQIWKDRLKLCQKKFFMVMTSSMTSQGGLTASLYIHV